MESFAVRRASCTSALDSRIIEIDTPSNSRKSAAALLRPRMDCAEPGTRKEYRKARRADSGGRSESARAALVGGRRTAAVSGRCAWAVRDAHRSAASAHVARMNRARSFEERESVIRRGVE